MLYLQMDLFHLKSCVGKNIYGGDQWTDYDADDH